MYEFKLFDGIGTTLLNATKFGILISSLLSSIKLIAIDNQMKVSHLCNSNIALQKYLKEGGNPDASLEKSGFNSRIYHLNNYPLIFCVSNEGAEILLQHGANPNIEFNGQTPLQKAFVSKNFVLMELLLKHGANPDSKSKKYIGFNLLHQATASGNEEIVKLLLKNGANVNIKNNRKATPLDIAIQRHQTEIAEILIEKGAVANIYSDSKKLRSLRKKIHKLKLKRYHRRLRQIKQQRKESPSD